MRTAGLLRLTSTRNRPRRLSTNVDAIISITAVVWNSRRRAFPLTVWIVPTVERKNKLIHAIREALDKQPRLFAVITNDELAHLIRYAGEGGTLC